MQPRRELASNSQFVDERLFTNISKPWKKDLKSSEKEQDIVLESRHVNSSSIYAVCLLVSWLTGKNLVCGASLNIFHVTNGPFDLGPIIHIFLSF